MEHSPYIVADIRDGEPEVDGHGMPWPTFERTGRFYATCHCGYKTEHASVAEARASNETHITSLTAVA